MKTLSNVLLIDDDRISNMVTETLIKGLHIREHVQTALNGEEGLTLLKKHCFETTTEHCPELILLHSNMPVMNGFEFLLHFEKVQYPFKPLVVIFSSSENPRDQQKAQQFQVAGFMTKPFELHKIQPVLHKCL